MNGNIAARLLTEWYAVLYMQQYHNNRCLGKSSILPSAKQSLRCSPPPDQHTPRHPRMSSNRKKRLSCQAMQHNNKNENISICSWRGLLQMPQFRFFFGPNDACCLTVTGDSATWLHPLPALTSAAYLDAPRSTHAHLRFAGSACAGPHRDATVSHPHNTDAHSATAAPSQGGSLLLESPPHHEP